MWGQRVLGSNSCFSCHRHGVVTLGVSLGLAQTQQPALGDEATAWGRGEVTERGQGKTPRDALGAKCLPSLSSRRAPGAWNCSALVLRGEQHAPLGRSPAEWFKPHVTHQPVLMAASPFPLPSHRWNASRAPAPAPSPDNHLAALPLPAWQPLS